MTNYLNTRDGEKFSDTEFEAIPRYSNGDIIDLFDAFCFITDSQREKLTGDDWSRFNEYEIELKYMASEEF